MAPLGFFAGYVSSRLYKAPVRSVLESLMRLRAGLVIATVLVVPLFGLMCLPKAGLSIFRPLKPNIKTGIGEEVRFLSMCLEAVDPRCEDGH